METAIPLQTLILAAFIVFNMVLIVVLHLRPQITAATGGKALAFLSLFVLPVVIFSGSSAHHLEKAKTTEFCLSCHVMEPYGRSLDIDSPDHLPASHFQNNRVPTDQACYTCHTSYAMFGDVRAKLNGVRHVYVNYFGDIPDQLTLYDSFKNRECLHCHAGGRNFEENEFHASMRAELGRDDVSCLECHASVHAVTQLDDLPTWTPNVPSTGGP